MAQSDLERLVPVGVPVSRRWLLAQGVTVSRLDNAVKSGKLTALTTGLYVRPDFPVDWKGVVFALQRERPGMVLGGVTALELQGRGHYVALAKQKHLMAFAPYPAPPWLKRLPVSLQVDWFGTARLWKDEVDVAQLATQPYEWRDGLSPLLVSAPERALLEVLSLVPQRTSFEHADNLFQGLTSLSPNRLGSVLQACENIKAKRLFFWLAHRYNYQWLARLNSTDYDLGSGKRVVEQGGRLDPEFLITVPETLYEPR